MQPVYKPNYNISYNVPWRDGWNYTVCQPVQRLFDCSFINPDGLCMRPKWKKQTCRHCFKNYTIKPVNCHIVKTVTNKKRSNLMRPHGYKAMESCAVWPPRWSHSRPAPKNDTHAFSRLKIQWKPEQQYHGVHYIYCIYGTETLSFFFTQHCLPYILSIEEINNAEFKEETEWKMYLCVTVSSFTKPSLDILVKLSTRELYVFQYHFFPSWSNSDTRALSIVLYQEQIWYQCTKKYVWINFIATVVYDPCLNVIWILSLFKKESSLRKLNTCIPYTSSFYRWESQL